MDQYLQTTTMLDYTHPSMQQLIAERGWRELDDYNKIAQIYSFVRNEILFGYNIGDTRKASEVLQDGIGQCNTKATLLISLLRAVGIPSRHHAFRLDNSVQKGAIPPALFFLAPKLILHTWAEVWYEDEWHALEGVILDDGYIKGFKKMFKKTNRNMTPCNFKGYGFGVDNLFELDVDWDGDSTYVQSTGITEDLGPCSSPDECYAKYSQAIGPIKNYIYSHITCKTMTKRVMRIRNTL